MSDADGSAPPPTWSPAGSSSRSSATADDFDDGDGIDGSSPALPHLPAPRLPDRALELLRTPPPPGDDEDEAARYVTTSWGSPYPRGDSGVRYLGGRARSLSSGPSSDSPIHGLEIDTPFLRPAPLLDGDSQQTSFSNAAVLANRARRPTRGLTEEWIRQHTAGGDAVEESRLWLSDGEGGENSSLSGSYLDEGEEEEQERENGGWPGLKTPKATAVARASAKPEQLFPPRTSSRHPRTRSSLETLKQVDLQRLRAAVPELPPLPHPPPVPPKMAASIDTDSLLLHDGASMHSQQSGHSQGEMLPPESPRAAAAAPTPGTPNREARDPLGGFLPVTPSRSIRREPAITPRLKKKVPWNGKNIMILLPRDDERGQRGKAPKPLTQTQTAQVFREWEQLGYDVRGFDLFARSNTPEAASGYAQSRDMWPSTTDVDTERSARFFKVTLPDLNVWKNYVDELNEAKLRALGVSFGDDDAAPPPPSISPAASSVSRQASGQYPPLPFSPPIPTSSASSGHPVQQFPFPAQFIPGTGSGTQSPIIPGISPVSFNSHVAAKFGRQSISIPAGEMPFGSPYQQPSPHPQNWSPHLQQVLPRHGSPSLNQNALVSPMSPFQPDGFQAVHPLVAAHQRHQSLQYPMLAHQLHLQQQARASPRLQDLREMDEETAGKSPSKTPEPSAFVRRNSDPALQREIDDAEYHLEEQIRTQLEHDDYSPHDDDDKVAAAQKERESSVQFAPQEPTFPTTVADGPVLHHPRPHTRGHSLSQKPFIDDEETQESSDGRSVKQQPSQQDISAPFQRAEETDEIVTNPSNLGTPMQGFDFANVMQQHQRSFSSASNPWMDAGSRRSSSHGSKPSLSKLNVQAPEFKFNPSSTAAFNPAQFVFGQSAFQPTAVFSAPVLVANPPPSATASQFSMSTSTSSKINVNAPAFSPGRSDFSFSAAGPKFRPDAPAFTPMQSFTDSVTSPASGSESAGNRSSSIFGNIDLDAASKVSKKSKAIPIVRPPSREESVAKEPELVLDQDGRVTDFSRIKRAKGNSSDDDAVPQFAAAPEPEEPDPESLTVSQPSTVERIVDDAADEEARSPAGDEEPAGPADTTLSSTMVSETTDTKAAASPTDQSSPEQGQTVSLGSSMNWRPFELESKVEMQDFNNARPFGEDPEPFTAAAKSHKKTLSAAARPFMPSATLFGPARDTDDDDDDVVDYPQPPSSAPLPVLDPHVPEFVPGGALASIETDAEAEVEAEAEAEAEAESAEPLLPSSPPAMPTDLSPPPKPRGLGASRFASPPKQELPARGGKSPVPEVPSPVQRTAGRETPAVDVEDEEEEQQMFVQREVDHDDKTPTVDGDEEEEPRALPEDDDALREQTFEEIDAVMMHMTQLDPTMGVRKMVEPQQQQPPAPAQQQPEWHHPSPTRHISLAAVTGSSPFNLLQAPGSSSRFDADATSPRQYHDLPDVDSQQQQHLHHLLPHPQLLQHHAMPSTELEDPFVDPPHSAVPSSLGGADGAHIQLPGGQVQRLNTSESLPASEWDGAFSDNEQAKLEGRANFFDGRVNDVVGTLLEARLDPLEKSLGDIRTAIALLASQAQAQAHNAQAQAQQASNSRRDRRSTSAELQESDADDEDDDQPALLKSGSPRRDRRLEQIRSVVLDAVQTHHASRAVQTPPQQLPPPHLEHESSSVLKALEEFKEQFGASMRLDFRGEDLRNIVEEAVERRMPPTPKPDDEAAKREEELRASEAELRARVLELEQKLHNGERNVEDETLQRRTAEDRAAELSRQLQTAETKIEIEIMNRSAFDQRIADLEDKLKHVEEQREAELEGRRTAEDRLSEVQRLLRIASEEEVRLREALDEREARVKSVEETRGKHTMRLALLEAADDNAKRTQADLAGRLGAAESDSREARKESAHWRGQAERLQGVAQRKDDELGAALDENAQLHKLVDTLGTQIQENERIREAWRAKFISLQDDMARAAKEISEENARRTKKEQAMLARQEVLDARLQAESKTRERLETEIERLEAGERAGMRAVADTKRLEALLAESRTDNHRLQQAAAHHQREAGEARDSAAAEVQRANDAAGRRLDEAREDVDALRAELDDQAARFRAQLDDQAALLRAQLDQARLDADTARARSEMLLEEAHSTGKAALDELENVHLGRLEDIQAAYERRLANAAEDGQRTEQNLLERLSLATSKAEHLQDKVHHLEDKLDLAKEAAQAAAQAAKAAATDNANAKALEQAKAAAAHATSPKATTRAALGLPEKISPQALRESILVLQEQLQEREQRIEELDATVARLDPDAAAKIAKRDDEITWLRELLAVRHGDLQDVIAALSPVVDGERGEQGEETAPFDHAAVRDAAIRLKANLQMEEQERERALNGGSALANLPGIAASIRDAASPRVAQAVGPLAAAWGNWRRSRESTAAFANLSGVRGSTPATAPGRSNSNANAASAADATPSKVTGLQSQNSFLSGLLTPPTSGLRQTPSPDDRLHHQHQPTAFGNTGRRYTGQQQQQQQHPASRARGPSSVSSSRRSEKMPMSAPPPSSMSAASSSSLQSTPPQRRQSSGLAAAPALTAPVTPPMMRPSAYDSDAHAEEFDDAGFFDD